MDTSSVTEMHAFIIAWTGKHEQALAIGQAIRSRVENLTIVYSDDDPDLTLTATDIALEVVPNAWFWGKKFEHCIHRSNDPITLVIHADTTCEDWSTLVDRARKAFGAIPHLGVYAPLIDYTYWDLGKVELGLLSDRNYSVVAQTDGIVFAMSRNVKERLRLLNYDDNIYGWGIDWAMVSYCYANRMIAIVDKAVKIDHPLGTGYDQQTAKNQEIEFTRQLDFHEQIQFRLLNAYYLSRC